MYDDEEEYHEPYDGDCKFGVGNPATEVIGGLIGLVVMIGIAATAVMAFAKIAVWAWA